MNAVPKTLVINNQTRRTPVRTRANANNQQQTKRPQTNNKRRPMRRNQVNNRNKRRPKNNYINGINNSMSRMTISKDHSFLKCRFSACTMSCSIPDGANGKHIPTSLYSMNTISTTGSSLFLQFNPWLPSPIMLHTNDFVTIDGNTIANKPSGNTGGGNTNGSYYIPLGLPTNIVGPASASLIPGGDVAGNKVSADIFSAASIRIAGIRFKITNTTAPMQRSGIYQCFENNMILQDVNLQTDANPPAAGQVGLNIQRYDAATLYNPRLGTPIFMAEGDVQTRAPTNNVETFPVSKPLTIYLKKNGKNYNTVPYFNINAAIAGGSNVTNTGVGTQALNNMLMSSALGSAACVNAFDNDYGGIGMIISGLSTTNANSIVIETFVSLEIKPTATSTVAQFTKDAPPANKRVMNHAEQVQQTLPSYHVEPR